MNARRYVLVIILTAVCSLPTLVAAANFVPLVQGSQGGLTSYQTTSNGDLSGYINKLFIIAISVGAMAAVLRLVYAGYIYMVSGVDSSMSLGKAKTIIGNVVFGLLLLLGIYLILFQINPDIVKLDITRNIK